MDGSDESDLYRLPISNKNVSTINGKPFSSPKNINLKGGILRFDVTHTSNPLGDLSYGLYVDASGNLTYRNLTTSTILGGAGGSYTAPSLDQIFAGDQTLDLTSLSTLTIDRSSGNNDVLTLTNTGAGSGQVIQITNAGTGYDIKGTSDTWSFTKTGDLVANKVVFAGDAGSNSLTLTAGDVVVSDGSFALTDADNAASFTITNNTATSASVVVIAGSGVFTGNTTSSFATLTASGLTTGTVLYIPVAALTTGKAINVIGTTALTTGIMVNVESGTTGTSLTGSGRLLRVAHTGTSTNSGVLAEVLSAATDETTIMQVSASGALALGYALKLSTASVTTGTLIGALGAALTTGAIFSCTDLAALTTGHGILISHETSAITTGSLLEISSSGVNTGSGGDGTLVNLTATGQLAGSLVTVDTIQTTGTAMSIISTGVMTTTGNLLTLTANSATTAAGLLRVNGNGLTTGIGVVIASSATAITTTGRLLSVSHTGTTSTSGTLVEFASAATDETIIAKITASAALAAGVCLDIVASSMTTGVGARIDSADALTTGILLDLESGATAITGAGRMLSVDHSGATTTSGILSEFKSAATDETVILQVLASAALAAGKIVNISGAAMTTGTALDIGGLDALTTGTGINVESDSADTTTRVLVQITNDNTAAVGTTCLSLKNDATAGAAMSITGSGILGIDMSALGVSDSLFKVTLTTDTTMKAPQTVAADGFIKVMVGAVAHYIPCYTVA